MRAARSHQLHSQRGAATLVVVMILFLIMALLAAYANRSLLFEQRISSGYYRASLAQDMAEGGVDWTVAMLNGTAIDGNCAPVATNGQRFVDRYFNVSATDRDIVRTSTKDPKKPNVDCVRTDTSLVCRCPSPDGYASQVSLTTGSAFQPSFGVALGESPNSMRGGFVILSRGCTDSSVTSCMGNNATREISQKSMANALQNAAVAFVSAVPASPSSALTVKGALTVTAAAGSLGLHNSDPKSTGTLVISGGPAPTLDDQRMDTLPGTPLSVARVFGDPDLHGMTSDRAFQVFMGVTPSRYKTHPALREVTCAGDCAQTLRDAYNAGKRMVFIDGDMTLSSNVVIGTATAPMLIVVYGNATLTGPFQLTGMLVAQDVIWTNNSGNTSMITGSVLATGAMNATGPVDILYQQSVADQLRNRLGSYVRVSGGWIDASDPK